MRRPIGVLAAASMFFFAGIAGAQDREVLTLKAALKADRSTGKELSFVYVSGDSLYPDGTRIAIALKAPDGGAELKQVACIIDHGRFLAEIGPWEQHFPPGRYRVVAEFRYEDQTAAVQGALGSFRDIERCIMTDADYAEKYDRENPERARLLREYIARTKRCPGKTGRGETSLVVGSEQDAERAVAIETEHLRGTAENAARLLRELTSPIDFHAWREECSALDSDLTSRRASVVCTARPAVSNALSVALLNLSWCVDDAETLTSGAGADLRRDIAVLEALGAKADRDDRRRLEKARASLAALNATFDLHAQSAAEAIASALYGPDGLQPAPARARAYVDELLHDLQVKPSPR